ncbi:hypothetical protein ERHA54_33120 [Erwinia rhapontici]|nr:hypothetical protein ERHA54_33120 [Erwinia rhapontici]BCQ46004.1 hypothetical protein ERHA55_35310 [Erwinia rhapontici]
MKCNFIQPIKSATLLAFMWLYLASILILLCPDMHCNCIVLNPISA